MLLMRDILSPLQLKRLSEHKYSSCGRTLLDPIVQPFWNWLVEKLPLWLAPNLMTISGLLINILTSLILICYSPDATHEAPRWGFILCAIGLFVYQTLDACDGKQARRTGNSSPLGELFDHGCDSLSTVFVALGVCVAVELGKFPSWMFLQCFIAMTLFYCAHWQTYVSGTLRFGRFDVTEAQYTVILIHMISAVFGPSIWSTEIPHIHIEIKLLPVFSGIIAGSVAFYSNFAMILTGGVGKNGSTVALPGLHVELQLLPIIVALIVSLVLCYNYSAVILSEGVGKNGSSSAGTSILSPLTPLLLVVVPAFVIYQKSTYGIYERHPCLYILAFGMVASKITNKLVIAHMTKSEIDYLDSVFIGPGMLFMNQYFNTYIDEYIVLWLCFVYSTVNLLHYCTIICRQICLHLHIYLFTIVPQKPSKSESSTMPSHLDTSPLLQNAPNDDPSETSDNISIEQSPSYHHSFLEEFTPQSHLDDEIP